MAIKPELKGKQHPPFEYEVGREKIREYAWAVGETNQVHLEPDAARAAGFRERRRAADVLRRLLRPRDGSGGARPRAGHQPRSDGARLAGVRVGRAGRRR